MSSAAPKIAETRSDRFAPFLSRPLGSGLCIAVSAVCYFVAIRFIDLWPFGLLTPMPLLAAAFAAPSRIRAMFCGSSLSLEVASDYGARNHFFFHSQPLWRLGACPHS